MRFPSLPFFAAATAVACMAITASAQQQSRSARPGDNSNPLPLQGKSLPAVSAFNQEGEKVDLAQALKGKHGVIVFGCLT